MSKPPVQTRGLCRVALGALMIDKPNQRSKQMTNAIRTVQTSVQEMHGSERDRTLKYQNFLAWQIAMRQKEHGMDPSCILKRRAEEFER